MNTHIQKQKMKIEHCNSKNSQNFILSERIKWRHLIQSKQTRNSQLCYTWWWNRFWCFQFLSHFLVSFPFCIHRTLNSQAHFFNFSLSTVFHPLFCLCLLTICSVSFQFLQPLHLNALFCASIRQRTNQAVAVERFIWTRAQDIASDLTGTKHNRCKMMLSD